MATFTAAKAYCNNEVAYVAWQVDGKIDGCLGFEVTRVYLGDDGQPLLTPTEPRSGSRQPCT